MIKDIFKRMLILALIALGLLAVIAGGVWIISNRQAAKTSPIVVIHSPGYGLEVNLGETIPVKSTSQDPAQNIAGVELWLESGGVMTLLERTNTLEANQSVSLTQSWQPTNLGNVRLIVRAFNVLGESGQAAVDLQIVESTAETTFSLQEGETLPPIGGIEFEAGAEGGQEGSPPQPPPPDPDPDPPESPSIIPAFFNIIMEPFFPAVTPGTWVEVEAVAFEVRSEYDELYCYVGLGSNPAQRVPDTGSFEVSNSYEWNLADYLGGNNKAVVLVPENEPLLVFLDCIGYDQTNNQTHWAGMYKAVHPPEEWTGEIIEGPSIDGEGYTISYRINPTSGSFVAPYNLHHIVTNNSTFMHWDWNGNESEIDGFKIFRGSNHVATVHKSRRMTEVPPWWIVPPCGEEYNYTILAYKNNSNSPASNQLTYQGENCSGQDDIRNRSLNSSCDNAVQRVKVRYQYLSMHGVASLNIRVSKDGEVVPSIFSTRVPIHHGISTAYVDISNYGPEPIQTDQLTFTMYDHANMPFYVETVNHTVNWGAKEPDLIIKKAWVDRPNHKLKVKIKNNACAGPLAETPFLSFMREDGWSGFHQFEHHLRAGAEDFVAVDLNPQEMDRWAGEINLEIDPLDNVDESNEDNNTYQIGEARVKRVEYTQSYILDDHDQFNDGEWDMYFKVCTAPCDLDTAPTIYKSYSWGTGIHQINGVFFNPILDSDDVLIIFVRAVEFDKYWIIPTYGYIGSVAAYHTPDGIAIPALDNDGFTHMGSWKAGGTHTATNSFGDYQITYKIVMDN